MKANIILTGYIALRMIEESNSQVIKLQRKHIRTNHKIEESSLAAEIPAVSAVVIALCIKVRLVYRIKCLGQYIPVIDTDSERTKLKDIPMRA